MSEKCNRELGDFYFSVLLKWQTWDAAMAFLEGEGDPLGRVVSRCLDVV